MIGDLPLGYATLGDFESHMARTFAESDRQIANQLLRTAEELINYHTGDRLFVPVKSTITAAIAADATSAYLDTDSCAFPSGGFIYIDSEVLEYTAPVAQEGRVKVTLRTRGVGETTAASHLSGANVSVVRGIRGAGACSLYPGDFLEVQQIWTGAATTVGWLATDIDYVVQMPLEYAPPFQWLERSGGWSKGALYWVAATWGYAWSVPASIQRATLLLAENMLLQRGANLRLIATEQWEGWSVRYRNLTAMPNDVLELLQPYRRIPLC